MGPSTPHYESNETGRPDRHWPKPAVSEAVFEAADKSDVTVRLQVSSQTAAQDRPTVRLTKESLPDEPDADFESDPRDQSLRDANRNLRGAAAPFRAAPARATGLSFSRHFTRPGISPFDEITWELRDAIIQDYKGRTIFEQKNVEVPADWSLTATNIVASKYLHGQVGTPERESGVRALITRVAESIRDWGIAGGYFATPADAATFFCRTGPPAAEPEGRVQFAGLVQRRLRPPGAELRRAELALEPGHPGRSNTAPPATPSRSARPASSTRSTTRSTPS